MLVLPQRGGTTHAFGKSLRSLHTCKQRAALHCPRRRACPRIRSARARPLALMWTRRYDAIQCPHSAVVVILAKAAILSSTRLSNVVAEDAARTCTSLKCLTEAGTSGRGWKLIVGGGRCGFGVQMSVVIQWLKQRLAQRDNTFLGADDSALEQDIVFPFEWGGHLACLRDPLDSLDGRGASGGDGGSGSGDDGGGHSGGGGGGGGGGDGGACWPW